VVGRELEDFRTAVLRESDSLGGGWDRHGELYGYVMRCRSWAMIVPFYSKEDTIGLRAGGQAWCLQRKYLPSLSDQYSFQEAVTNCSGGIRKT
jgi:hypothetical protein